MSGFFSNSSNSIFATENDIQSLQNNIAPDMMQHFKNVAGFVPIALVGTGTFNVLYGYDQESVLPGDNFSVISPGVFQYNGADSNIFFISYSVSGLLSTNDSPITFLITRDNAILPASAQIQDFIATAYESISGHIILELQTGNQISIKAELNAALGDTFQLENIKLSAFKISPA